MRRCVAICISQVQVVIRIHKHLQNGVAVLELGTQVQSIIVTLNVRVVDLDAVLGKHTHHIAMAMLCSDPEGVYTLFVLLVDIYHLVLEHQAHEFFANET